MKIADVAEFYAEAGGGVRTYIDHKLRAATDAGHEMIVIAPGNEDREEARHGGRILWVKNPPMPGDPRYRVFVHERAVHRCLDHERPDIIEGSSVYGGGWFVARWAGPAAKSLVFHQDPVAVFAHSAFDRFLAPNKIDRASAPVWVYLRKLAARYDVTVVAGQWLQDRLSSFGVPRVQAIPFGIDPAPFLAAKPDPELRKTWLAQAQLPADAPVLISVSRHHPEKRLPTLIEAIRMVGQARPIGLVIYGDGPMRSRVDALAQQVPGVIIAGYTRDRDQLAQAVATADAFLHGSAAETYGLVIAEAMAARTPLIVPNAGGAAELVEPAYAETYIPGDSTDCAAAIRRMLSRDREEMDRMVAALTGHPIRTLDAHFEELFGYYSDLHTRRVERSLST